jgi:protein TonB
MKTCPQCRAQYDDYMRFCLQDGTPLAGEVGESVTEDVTETFDFPKDTTTQQTEAVTEEWSETNASTETVEQTVGNQVSPTNQFAATPTLVQSEPQRSRNGLFLGVFLLGGLLLLGSTIGGVSWYLSSQKSTETALVSNNPTNIVNLNKTQENPNFEVSNAEIVDNSNQIKSNSATNTNTMANLKISPTPTPKPTATPKPEETQTLKKSPTPEVEEVLETNTLSRNAYDPLPPERPTPKRVPKMISGGVVNGKAISLPKPNYPAAAKAVNAKGAVNVQVLIDEDGNVKRARAVSGHPLLRSAAENAARGAKFRPTELAGQAVKVTGVIVYNFN